MKYEKAKVADAIRAMGDEFMRRWNEDEQWKLRVNSGDDAALDEVALVGCENTGIAFEDYCKGIDDDAELHALQKSLIYDAVMYDLQPGPDNPAARESVGARTTVTISDHRVPKRRWWQFW